MTELEIIIHAKNYIDSLANGINPLDNQKVNDSDIVNNVRISKCLFYVSDILQQVIDNGGKVSKTVTSQLAKFNLTDEQKRLLVPEQHNLSSTKIINIINATIDTTVMKKLKVTTLNNWLVSIGILKEVTINGKNRKFPTPNGYNIGVSEATITDEKGYLHKYCVYDANAQQFIFDNIDSIIEFAKNECN